MGKLRVTTSNTQLLRRDKSIESAKAKPINQATNELYQLHFRQESSDMPADTESFPPIYMYGMKFKVVGVFATWKDQDTTGEIDASLSINDTEETETNFVETDFDDADLAPKWFSTDSADEVIIDYRDKVTLLINSSVDLDEFEAIFLMRRLK